MLAFGNSISMKRGSLRMTKEGSGRLIVITVVMLSLVVANSPKKGGTSPLDVGAIVEGLKAIQWECSSLNSAL